MGAAGEPVRQTAPQRTGAPVGVYRPRRPRASPLYRLLDDHFQTFTTVYDERFAPRWGPWRRVVPAVVEKFLACGILEHGFARVRCGGCRHKYLLAFSCKCRYFCPSCHAKRLAVWSLWLEETLLAPVPHRQVVLTVPKRLRGKQLRSGQRVQGVSPVIADDSQALIYKLSRRWNSGSPTFCTMRWKRGYFRSGSNTAWALR